MKAGSSASRIAAVIIPKQTQVWIAALETIVIMAAAVLGAAYLHPDDPLLLKKPFPWLWLGPLLLALQYGTVGAIGASSIMLCAWAFFHFDGWLGNIIPAQFFLGGLIITFGAGQFSDIWSGRLKRVRSVNFYLDQRLDALTRRHFLLKHDYERMEQGLLSRPMTLRQALNALRSMDFSDKSGEKSGNGVMPHAQELLNLLAATCQIESASLHGAVKGRLQPRPVATLGGGVAMDSSDVMVRMVLRDRELCHVQTQSLQKLPSKYLVVAPVLDSAGRELGLLLIERMPFINLTTEVLQLITVILGYYADMIETAPEVRSICKRMPDCPPQFANELVRLHKVYEESKIPSTLVALRFDSAHEAGREGFLETLRMRRQIDLTWPIRGRQRSAILTLMPLYDEAAAQGYVTRIQKQFGSDGKFSSLSVALGERSPEEMLVDVLEDCHALAD